MEKSKLENLSNNTLYKLCYMVMSELDDYRSLSFDDSDFIDTCDGVLKLFSIQPEYIDYDFILNILKTNDFKDSTPQPLKKPKVSHYKFDYDEHRKEYVRRTYEHKIYSYSNGKNDFIELLNLMDNNGDLDYYNGREVDVDYYDGETTDIKLDKNSIEKV
jgi:hypothetical protein